MTTPESDTISCITDIEYGEVTLSPAPDGWYCTIQDLNEEILEKQRVDEFVVKGTELELSSDQSTKLTDITGDPGEIHFAVFKTEARVVNEDGVVELLIGEYFGVSR